MTHPGVCIHGSLRRSCEPCDLADRLEQAERERDEARAILTAVRVALAGQAGVTDVELSCPEVRGVIDALAALNRTNALRLLEQDELAQCRRERDEALRER